MWDLIVSVPDHCLSFYFGFDQQATLYQKNRVSMILYHNGIWSADDFRPEEASQHDVI